MAGLNLKVNVSVLQATRELNRLGQNLGKLRSEAVKSQTSFGFLSATLRSTTTLLIQLGGALAVFGAGGAARKAIEFSADFEKSLADINTILGDSEISLDSYKQRLLDLSTQSSKTLNDLSRGLYQTISAGIPSVEGAAGAFSVLEAAQKAAVAGLTETEVAVDAVTSVLNTYGSDSLFATDVTDKLFTAVRLGKTRFDDLARGVGRVAPIAKEAGISLDELLATFVAITRKGISPREAITGLRNTIRSIIKPSKQSIEALEAFNAEAEKAGRRQIDLSAGALRDKGLIGFLNELSQFNAGEISQLNLLFPNIRALLPIISTTGEGVQTLNEVFAEFGNTAGETQQAFDKVDKVFSETLDKVISNIGRLAVIGSENALNELNKFFQDLNVTLGSSEAASTARQIFDSITDGVKFVARNIGLASEVLLRFVGVLGRLAALQGVIVFFSLLAKGLDGFSLSAKAASVSLSGLLKGFALFAATLYTLAPIVEKVFGNRDTQGLVAYDLAKEKFNELAKPGEKLGKVIERSSESLKEQAEAVRESRSGWQSFLNFISGGAQDQEILNAQIRARNDFLREQKDILDQLAKARGFAGADPQFKVESEVKSGTRFDFSTQEGQSSEELARGLGQFAPQIREATRGAISDLRGFLDGEFDTIGDSILPDGIEVELKADTEGVRDKIDQDFESNKALLQKSFSEIEAFFTSLQSLGKGSLLTVSELQRRLEERLKTSGNLGEVERRQAARLTARLILAKQQNVLLSAQNKLVVAGGDASKDQLRTTKEIADSEEVLAREQGKYFAAQEARNRAGLALSDAQKRGNRAEIYLRQNQLELADKNLALAADGLKNADETARSLKEQEFSLRQQVFTRLRLLGVSLGLLQNEDDQLAARREAAALEAEKLRRQQRAQSVEAARLQLENIRLGLLAKERQIVLDLKKTEEDRAKASLDRLKIQKQQIEDSIAQSRRQLSFSQLLTFEGGTAAKILQSAAKSQDEIIQKIRERAAKSKEIISSERNLVKIQEKLAKLDLSESNKRANDELQKTLLKLRRIQDVLGSSEVAPVAALAAGVRDAVEQLNNVERTNLVDSEDANRINDITNQLLELQNTFNNIDAEMSESIAEAYGEQEARLQQALSFSKSILQQQAKANASAMSASIDGAFARADFSSALQSISSSLGVSLEVAASNFGSRLTRVAKQFGVDLEKVNPFKTLSKSLDVQIQKLIDARKDLLIAQAKGGPEDIQTANKQFFKALVEVSNNLTASQFEARQSGDGRMLDALNRVADLIPNIASASQGSLEQISQVLNRDSTLDMNSELVQSLVDNVLAQRDLENALSELRDTLREAPRQVRRSFVDAVADFTFDFTGVFREGLFNILDSLNNVADRALDESLTNVGVKLEAWAEGTFGSSVGERLDGLFDKVFDGDSDEGSGEGSKQGSFSITGFLADSAKSVGGLFSSSDSGEGSGAESDAPGLFQRIGDSFSQGLGALSEGFSSLSDPNTWKGIGGSFLGAVDKGFNVNARLFVGAFEKGASVVKHVVVGALELGAKVLAGVMTRVLGSIGGIVSKPFDLLFGSLDAAFGTLVPDMSKREEQIEKEKSNAEKRRQAAESEKKAAEQERRKAEAEAERVKAEREKNLAILDTVKALKDVGASNEEIARAQSQIQQQQDFVEEDFSDDALDEPLGQEEEKGAQLTMEDMMDRAVQLAAAIAENIGPILESFLTKMVEILPGLISNVVNGLANAIRVLAQNLPEILTTVVAAIVDALPIIIDALVDSIPYIITALLDSLTVILENLPDIIISLIDSIIENIPLIITSLVNSLPQVITALVGSIPTIVMALLNSIPVIIQELIYIGVPRIIGALIQEIPNMVGAFVIGIKDGVVNAFSRFVEYIGNVGRIFRAVGGVFQSLYNGFVDIVNAIGGFFTGGPVGDFFSGAWDTITSWFHDGGNVTSGMRNSKVADVWRNAGVRGYATGGMVSDRVFSSMRASMSDDVPAILQVGEAVLNRQAVENIGGPDAVNMINSGGVPAGAPSGDVKLNVSINPNASGMSSVAAAILPMLIDSISVSQNDSEPKSQKVQGLTGRAMGYRPVRGV